MIFVESTTKILDEKEKLYAFQISKIWGSDLISAHYIILPCHKNCYNTFPILTSVNLLAEKNVLFRIISERLK
jgi:hypothetical protein